MLPPASKVGDDFVEDWVLIRLHRGSSTHTVLTSLRKAARITDKSLIGRAVLPSAIVSLGELRSLPFSLSIFFGLLAIATVAHALVTTIRRRRHDLAVLRAVGFTRHDTRIAIAWQSTLIALVGVVIGVPLGVIAGRAVWKQLAESFPVAYVPPFALVAVLLVVPMAIVIANLVAAGPAHAATRIRPATALRTE
jgi:ABC-type antimicrobial peptide transport system permease subunit